MAFQYKEGQKSFDEVDSDTSLQVKTLEELLGKIVPDIIIKVNSIQRQRCNPIQDFILFFLERSEDGSPPQEFPLSEIGKQQFFVLYRKLNITSLKWLYKHYALHANPNLSSQSVDSSSSNSTSDLPSLIDSFEANSGYFSVYILDGVTYCKIQSFITPINSIIEIRISDDKSCIIVGFSAQCDNMTDAKGNTIPRGSYTICTVEFSKVDPAQVSKFFALFV